MNILLIHQYFLEDDEPGGSRFNEMTRIWSQMGHQVTVLAGMVHYATGKKRREYDGKWFVKKNHEKVIVWRCHVSEAYNINFLGRLWAYFSFVFSASWAGWFKAKGKYDLILVTSPPLFLGLTAWVLSKTKRIPYIFEVRDLWPESAIDTGVVTNRLIIRLAFWLESFSYKHARLINVLTPAFRLSLIEKKNVPPDKIIFIPNAADFSLSENILEQFDPVSFRHENGISNRFVITYVGAHGVANHLIQLLDAAELLTETNVLFQFIGDGMQKPMLMEEAKNRNLNNVLFLDPVPKREVFKYIIASDLCTSVLKKVDTFKTIYSNKTFDYMACKKPILLLIDGVSRELVEQAQCGIYAEPENPEDIVAKIRYYLSNPDLLKLHGENGYRYAKTHFDRNVLAKRYLEHMSIITGI